MKNPPLKILIELMAQ